MKKYVTKATLYVIAFLLFFFGNAVNVLHFCCDICRDQGTQVITENLCHEQTDALYQDDTENSMKVSAICSGGLHAHFPFQISQQHNACSVERISINMEDFTREIKSSPLVVKLLFISGFVFDGITDRNNSSFSFTCNSLPVPLFGRQILNKICVLRN